MHIVVMLRLFSASMARTRWHDCRLNDTFQRHGAPFAHTNHLEKRFETAHVFVCMRGKH